MNVVPGINRLPGVTWMRPLGVCNSARSTHIQAPCRSRRKYLLMFCMPSPWQLQSPYSLESMCCWGFSSFYNIPSASSSSALWMRPEWSELRHAAWASECAGWLRAGGEQGARSVGRRYCCCARAVTRASWCLNAYLVSSPEKERAS